MWRRLGDGWRPTTTGGELIPLGAPVAFSRGMGILPMKDQLFTGLAKRGMPPKGSAERRCFEAATLPLISSRTQQNHYKAATLDAPSPHLACRVRLCFRGLQSPCVASCPLPASSGAGGAISHLLQLVVRQIAPPLPILQQASVPPRRDFSTNAFMQSVPPTWNQTCLAEAVDVAGSPCYHQSRFGGVAEWTMATVLKTVSRFAGRGFESYLLRHQIPSATTRRLRFGHR